MIQQVITHIKDVISSKSTLNTNRSSRWPEVRKLFLAGKKCAVCNGIKHLEAHHLQPFHLHPELELDDNNLLPLCEDKENGINCHLAFGHLGNFKSININCIKDSKIWNKKIANRP
jgi:5-methylcytosine-specific restriction protein A